MTEDIPLPRNHNPRRPGRRSCFHKSPYRNRQPMPLVNEKAELRAVLVIADEQDSRVPDQPPRARIFALRQVKSRWQHFPVKGKNTAQRKALESGIQAMARNIPEAGAVIDQHKWTVEFEKQERALIRNRHQHSLTVHSAYAAKAKRVKDGKGNNSLGGIA